MKRKTTLYPEMKNDVYEMEIRQLLKDIGSRPLSKFDGKYRKLSNARVMKLQYDGENLRVLIVRTSGRVEEIGVIKEGA